MILPLNLLRKLHLGMRQKVGLAAIFGIGFVIIAVAIARLFEVTPATTNVTENVNQIATAPMTLSAWSHIEASVAVIVASLPTFRFLLSRAANRNYDGSEPKQPQDFSRSVHTIGSGSQKKTKRSKAGSTTLGSLDEEMFGSANELNDLDQSCVDNGIRKQVDYVVSDEIVQPDPRYSEGLEQRVAIGTDEYRKRVHPNHLPVPGDTDTASSDSSARKGRDFV